jgi:hypothetical protein
MKKILIGLAVAATALFGLTACGGYDASDDPSVTEEQKSDNDNGLFGY